jgi:hypothetical protein
MGIKQIILALVATIGIVFIYSAPALAADCGQDRRFFGLPTWYKHLPMDSDCNIDITEKVVDENGKVNDKVTFKNIWLIALAVIEILLSVAGIIAVVYVIAGGFKYVVARGTPEKIVEARKTILNALVGAVIAVLASQVVSFIATKFATGATSPGGLPDVSATPETMVSIFNVVLTLIGGIVVLVIVIAGLDFMFSQGEPDKISRARNTIIYALIGMVIIIFAAVIVNFVIGAVG